MARIKLKTDNKCEQIILNYLEKNASDDLVERINNGNKTLTQCWNYITSEAKKEAKNGCACIEDATVYGWAVHFFEEDSISGEAFNKSTPVKTATSAKASASESAPVEKPKKKAKADVGLDQISFGDLFG